MYNLWRHQTNHLYTRSAKLDTFRLSYNQTATKHDQILFLVSYYFMLIQIAINNKAVLVVVENGLRDRYSDKYKLSVPGLNSLAVVVFINIPRN